MNTIPKREIAKVPYISHIPNDGRTIFLLPYFDHGDRDWHLYMEVKPGELGRVAGGESVVGTYFSSKPVDPKRDIYFPLATLIVQHLSFPILAGSLHALELDFHNFAAILEKFLVISLQPKPKRNGASLLVSTELEYLIIVIRSVYDLLQKLAKYASALIKTVETPHKPMVKELPDSFARIALDGDRLRSQDEIMSHYQLPSPLACFYAEEALYFKHLRDLRIAIEHHGKSQRLIFDLNDGMAVSIEESPWSMFPIWKQEMLRNNKLGPLRAIFAHLILHTIEMTTRYATAYKSCISVPEAIAPGNYLYLRNYFSSHLVNLKDTISNPWERVPNDRT